MGLATVGIIVREAVPEIVLLQLLRQIGRGAGIEHVLHLLLHRREVLAAPAHLVGVIAVVHILARADIRERVHGVKIIIVEIAGVQRGGNGVDIPALQRIIHGVEVGAYRAHVRPQVLHLVERDKISARTYKTPLQCAVGSVERIIKNRRRAAGEHKQCQQHTQEADGSLFHGRTSFLFFITVYHS